MEHFSRTRRLLGRQRWWRHTGIVAALVLLFASWAVWLSRGQVPVYVVSKQARAEVRALPMPVQASVDGQVTFSDVRLGREVAKGDVLLKLDARTFELRRNELRVAVRTGTASIEALRAQLAAEQGVREAVQRMDRDTSRTAAARVSLDKKSLDFKEKESEIAARLREATAISALEELHTAAGAETQRAQVLATSAQAALDQSSSKMTLRDREARLATVRISMAQAEAEVAKWTAQLETLDYEVERRTIRAPSSGLLADVMSVSDGMTLTSLDRIATLLPKGPLRIVALFAPQESIGRVRAGQPATLRFDNFPWGDFGTVGAVVDEVAQEPRDGLIRVELSATRSNPEIPIQHGLTGSCEIEVERTSPLRLLLRSVGHLPPTLPRASGQPHGEGARGAGVEPVLP